MVRLRLHSATLVFRTIHLEGIGMGGTVALGQHFLFYVGDRDSRGITTIIEGTTHLFEL